MNACRRCGCTDGRACYSDELGACWWVEDDLCSRCVPRWRLWADRVIVHRVLTLLPWRYTAPSGRLRGAGFLRCQMWMWKGKVDAIYVGRSLLSWMRVRDRG